MKIKSIRKNLEMKEVQEQKGITLLALAITIIVLLILAGITIGVLTGDNGIINNTKTAKEETEIANEKEILEKATVEAMGKNKYGNIEETELQNALNQETGDGKAEAVEVGDEFEVLFKESNRYYIVDKDGNVGEMNEYYEDKNPGDITIGKDGEKLEGSKEQPYEIWCIEDLVKLSEMVNNGDTLSGKYVVLKTDLNFNSNFSYMNPNTTEFDVYLGGDGNISLKSQLSEDGKGFMPIGKDVYNIAFRGDFDGQNHSIKNIYINKGANAGLFGAVFGGTNTKKIANLTVGGQVITDGGIRAGGIVAWARGVLLIENCHSEVNIKGSAYGMGGIVGICQYNDVEIKNCTNEGSLENLNNTTGTGGIIGVIQDNLQVDIVNTYNVGMVNGIYRVGGLIGDLVGTANIYNCYQLKEVTGYMWTGGIIGKISSNSSKVVFRNIYNIGGINCNSSKGGIIGTLNSDSININSNNVYYKKENGLTGIYNKDDSKFNITGYGEEEWDSNDIVQKLNSGRETQEEGIDKSEWKRWKLGENGYPIFE